MPAAGANGRKAAKVRRTRASKSARAKVGEAAGRAGVEAWLAAVKPELRPIAKHLDSTVRARVPGLRFAVKSNWPAGAASRRRPPRPR